jgi:hypothetical protein
MQQKIRCFRKMDKPNVNIIIPSIPTLKQTGLEQS